ncbi:MAG TPA: hypothetical protein VGQ57_13305, partial [Polyangiaceae bacterium]|nr:hypothetical protein [Polyangiaceae bacterium]
MLAVLLLVLAVLCVYVQSLGGPFLWDDRLLVLDAPLVEKAASLTDYFRNPFWMGAGAQVRDPSYYRPLVTLSFAFDHRLHASNPGGYHLTNVALHLASALCLYALLRRGRVRSPVAALACAAWALQPRLAEAVAWISGRTDVLAGLFVLAALLAWKEGLGRRVLSAAFFGLALGAKESAVALPFAIAASEGWRAHSTGERGLRTLQSAVIPVLPHAVVLILYAVGRVLAVGYPRTHSPLGAGHRTLTVLQAAGTYAISLLDPWQPRAVIGRIGAFRMPVIAAGALALLVAGALLFRARRHLTPDMVRGLTLAAGSLLPVLHLVPIPLRTLAADRFLYLPTAGLALALAPLADRFLGLVRVRWIAASAVTLSLSAVAFVRVGVWSDELEFWVRTYLETPTTNNAATTELLGVYYRAGRYREALALAARARDYDDPNQRDAAYNAALCLNRLGEHAEAERGLLALRKPGSFNADIESELALIAVQTGRIAEARPRLAELVRRGDARGRFLAARLDELAAARAALVALPPGAAPERRARLASLLGEERMATRAWRAVVAAPGSPP